MSSSFGPMASCLNMDFAMEKLLLCRLSPTVIFYFLLYLISWIGIWNKSHKRGTNHEIYYTPLTSRSHHPTSKLKLKPTPTPSISVLLIARCSDPNQFGQQWPFWFFGPWPNHWALSVDLRVNYLRDCHCHNDPSPCLYHHTFALSRDGGNNDARLQWKIRSQKCFRCRRFFPRLL